MTPVTTKRITIKRNGKIHDTWIRAWAIGDDRGLAERAVDVIHFLGECGKMDAGVYEVRVGDEMMRLEVIH